MSQPFKSMSQQQRKKKPNHQTIYLSLPTDPKGSKKCQIRHLQTQNVKKLYIHSGSGVLVYHFPKQKQKNNRKIVRKKQKQKTKTQTTRNNLENRVKCKNKPKTATINVQEKTRTKNNCQKKLTGCSLNDLQKNSQNNSFLFIVEKEEPKAKIQNQRHKKKILKGDDKFYFNQKDQNKKRRTKNQNHNKNNKDFLKKQNQSQSQKQKQKQKLKLKLKQKKEQEQKKKHGIENTGLCQSYQQLRVQKEEEEDKEEEVCTYTHSTEISEANQNYSSKAGLDWSEHETRFSFLDDDNKKLKNIRSRFLLKKNKRRISVDSLNLKEKEPQINNWRRNITPPPQVSKPYVSNTDLRNPMNEKLLNFNELDFENMTSSYSNHEDNEQRARAIRNWKGKDGVEFIIGDILYVFGDMGKGNFQVENKEGYIGKVPNKCFEFIDSNLNVIPNPFKGDHEGFIELLEKESEYFSKEFNTHNGKKNPLKKKNCQNKKNSQEKKKRISLKIDVNDYYLDPLSQKEIFEQDHIGDKKAIVIKDYKSLMQGHLCLKKDQILYITGWNERGLCQGEMFNENEIDFGLFPSHCIKLIKPKKRNNDKSNRDGNGEKKGLTREKEEQLEKSGIGKRGGGRTITNKKDQKKIIRLDFNNTFKNQNLKLNPMKKITNKDIFFNNNNSSSSSMGSNNNNNTGNNYNNKFQIKKTALLKNVKTNQMHFNEIKISPFIKPRLRMNNYNQNSTIKYYPKSYSSLYMFLNNNKNMNNNTHFGKDKNNEKITHRVRSIKPFLAKQPFELSIELNWILKIHNKLDNDWLLGETEMGEIGIFPLNCVQSIDEKNISKVQVLSTFIPSNDQQLGVIKNQVIEKIEDCGDYWILAKKEFEQQCGLVPKKLVILI
ncbi:ephexin-1 [Anaeramoeba flamelloides]|uniref:Ephexin-1 n=1 Tax=Anaeramoeba flamelloides TaxID=1746091 RepID=A0AAV7ZXX1_9EUKA|nr:ephexin-1 [Anaeramoeba flamelloides]